MISASSMIAPTIEHLTSDVAVLPIVYSLRVWVWNEVRTKPSAERDIHTHAAGGLIAGRLQRRQRIEVARQAVEVALERHVDRLLQGYHRARQVRVRGCQLIERGQVRRHLLEGLDHALLVLELRLLPARLHPAVVGEDAPA